MIRILQRLSLGLAFAAILVAAMASPVRAQSIYDGLWSVLIITEQGTCDRGYRYAVRIRRGNVGHADPSSSSFNIRGWVNKGGGIRVSVTRGDKRADGTGRMSRNGGAGKWRSSRGECSGVWSAERRGA